MTVQEKTTKVKEKSVEAEITSLGTLIGQVLDEMKQRGQQRKSFDRRGARCFHALPRNWAFSIYMSNVAAERQVKSENAI